MLFADIPGLHDLKQQLIKGVKQNHIAHAQLFLGKAGTANLPMALAYANLLNCANKGENDACGICDSCTKNTKFIHPDFHFSFPVAANDEVKSDDAKLSNSFLKYWRIFLQKNAFGSVADWTEILGVGNKQLNISKDESRNIIKNLSLKAFIGAYKVILIWLPEYLHPTAANALLKIIEEPTDKTVFLLVSNNQGKLLGTITSRTQSVFVPAYSDAEIMDILVERHEVEQIQAAQLAHLAQGDLHRAIALIDDVADDTQQEFEQWMRECYTADYTSLVKRADLFHKSSKLSQQQWLVHASNVIREALMASIQSKALMRIPAAHIKFVENFSKTITIERGTAMTELLNDMAYHLERNASAKMAFLNLSVNFSKIFRG